MGRWILLLALSYAVLPLAARADVASDAHRLLASRVRQSSVDPKSITIRDVVVQGNQALLSWDSGKEHGVMGLIRLDDRWWDALDMTREGAGSCWFTTTAYPLPVITQQYPADYRPPPYEPAPSSAALTDDGLSAQLVQIAAERNADVRNADAQERKLSAGGKLFLAGCDVDWYSLHPDARVRANGGVIHPPVRSFTSGFDFTLRYGSNNAPANSRFTLIYVRPPTQAEFLPNPPPPKDWGGSTDVGFFDFDVSGTQPVTFNAGTAVDIWFPFVLDDTLRYDVSLFTGGKAYGPYHGTLFDNVLHFELPAFTVAPGKGFQAEISGWY